MKRIYRKLWGLTLATTLSGVMLFTSVASAAQVHKVRPGESLSTIAQRHRIDVETLARINGIKDTDMIKIGDELKLSEEVKAQKYTVRPGESLWTIARKHGMDVKTLAQINGIGDSDMIKPGMELLLDAVPHKYKVQSGENLWTIARKFGVKYHDLISYNNLKNPDQIRIGTELMIPPLKTNSNKLTKGTIQSPVSKTSRPVVQQAQFIWPAKGRISSPFGPRWGRMHEGIDIALPVGKNIAAAANGKVIYGGWINGYGWAVIIDHKDGYRTLYAHNSKVLVKGGDQVKQGQLIAKSGNSGRSTGPHLHFEVQKNGRSLDPMKFLR